MYLKNHYIHDFILIGYIHYFVLVDKTIFITDACQLCLVVCTQCVLIICDIDRGLPEVAQHCSSCDAF